MTAKQLVDLIRPDHDRHSCKNDEYAEAADYPNGFHTYEIGEAMFDCRRCALLQLIRDGEVPEGFNVKELF